MKIATLALMAPAFSCGPRQAAEPSVVAAADVCQGKLFDVIAPLAAELELSALCTSGLLGGGELTGCWGYGLSGVGPHTEVHENSEEYKRRVSQTLEASLPAIRDCYSAELNHGRCGVGRVVARFVISPAGTVSDVSADSINEPLATCVKRSIADTRFADDRGRRSAYLELRAPYSLRVRR